MSDDAYKIHIGPDGYVTDRVVTAPGVTIDWSKTTPEAVIELLADLLRAYQDTPMQCAETARAIRQCGMFKEALRQRDADREARGVKGKREP
jgi:hypothetical protein